MDKIRHFLQELNDLQEAFGLYIVTETEEEVFVSLDRTSNNHMIVCMTGNTTIEELDEEKAHFDITNLEKANAAE